MSLKTSAGLRYAEENFRKGVVKNIIKKSRDERELFSLTENPTFEVEQIRNGFSLAATLLTGTNKSI